VIHPTAIIEPGAVIGENVAIGPYCHVGGNVVLRAGVTLHSHVVVAGHTEIGAGTTVYPFASLGHPPQDLKFKGEASRLVIGEGNVIREHVTMNPGTEGGGMLTAIGNGGLFMVGAHVAHDCRVGDRVIMANNATLAGHVHLGEHAIIGGLSAVHQFVRIGAHAMIGGMSGVENDVIPYGLVMGERAKLAGLNLVGLERRGFSKADISTLRRAYRILFGPQGTLAERLDEASEMYAGSVLVSEIAHFMRQRTSRGLTLPRGVDE
jgi:UDP-N-acetylglucosamine acyltransferase